MSEPEFKRGDAHPSGNGKVFRQYIRYTWGGRKGRTIESWTYPAMLKKTIKQNNAARDQIRAERARLAQWTKS